jgi:hypothetical protein
MLDNTLLKRIRAEYLEMPGLRLTLAQAQRLCGVNRADCKAVLDGLVDAKFLCRKPDGAYARSSEGPQPAWPSMKDLAFRSQPQIPAASRTTA